MSSGIVLSKGGEALADSRVVAEKFGKRHTTVVRSIERLVEEYKEFSGTDGDPKLLKGEAEYRGTKYTYYEMDREFFSMLCMRFKGRQAFEWQRRFYKAFDAMECALIRLAQNQQNEMWLAQREQSKLVRREETDVIKEFVEYATRQGSQSAQFYYKHITTAVYKCLGLVQYKQPKLRETLDMLETSQLILAEMTAKKSLLKYMEQGEHYKAIFALVKKDLEAFADSFITRPPLGGKIDIEP